MSDARRPGWQSPARPPAIKCAHLGAALAKLGLAYRREGDEWVCGCGQVFMVVSDAGRDKRLVPRR